MNALSNQMLRKLLDATEVLHAHGHGVFHERVFEAVNVLYRDTYHAFEVYGLRSASHAIESDMPFPEKRRAELLRRTGEVVPVDHPIFPLILKGVTDPQRLSDLISMRALRCTDLYNDIFATVDVKYQIAVPFATGKYAGGLSINRGGKDFTDEDLFAAALLSRHLLMAYHTEQLLSVTAGARTTLGTVDFTALRRRGLSKRECEVLWWVCEGKRDTEIALILGISPRTASKHVGSILAKLKVETRTAAAAAAFGGR